MSIPTVINNFDLIITNIASTIFNITPKSVDINKNPTIIPMIFIPPLLFAILLLSPHNHSANCYIFIVSYLYPINLISESKCHSPSLLIFSYTIQLPQYPTIFQSLSYTHPFPS